METASTTETDMTKVIARIQKLLARSGRDGDLRGATEAEADTAMRHVQELMLKHNLDMATIEAAGRSAEDTGGVRVKESLEGKTRQRWQRDLAKYVAEANFCYHLIKEDFVRDAERRIVYDTRGNAKKVKSHVFVGRKANVITAQMMYAYLTQTIEDNAPEDDARVQVGRTYTANYKYREYSIRALEDGTFVRTDCEEPMVRAEDRSFKTLTAAAKFITRVEVNGYVFWGLGSASTAVSWKDGCADRICERLAKKRDDLIKEHDARIRAEEEAQKAEAERRRAEHAKKRTLGARPPTTDEIRETLFDGAFAAPTPSDAPIDAERPEETDAAWAPGADADEAQPIEAPQTGSALVLASAYSASEHEANEEMAKGYPPGTFAKWRAESEARRAARDAVPKREVPEEEWAPGATTKPETEKQRIAREKREADDYARTRARWAREDQRSARKAAQEHAKRDHKAYRAGVAQGDRIGLDPQVGSTSAQKKLDR